MPSQRGSMSLVRWGQEGSSVGGGCRLDVLALAGVRRLWVPHFGPRSACRVGAQLPAG